MLTVKCAERLRSQAGQGDEWGPTDDTARLIRAFLKPLLPLEKKDSADPKISELCRKVGDLVLTLRGSKSTYECRVFKKGDPIDDSDDSDMVPQDYEGQARSLNEATVAYTLFGALIKVRHVPSRSLYVLEKAHIICQ